MENLHKTIIVEKWDILKENISIQVLLNDLYSAQLLNRHDFEVIESKPNTAEKLEYFFQILSSRDHTGKRYEEFADVLQKHYPWLYNDLSDAVKSDKWKDERLKVALLYGDFPRKPAHYVKRRDKIEQVRNILQSMKIGDKVVLHGMTGCGKSSMAAGVMDAELVLETFDSKVFWINVGKADQEKIKQLMYRLYYKLAPPNERPFHENNSDSLDDMQLLLKNRILKENPHNKQMLLILDNVSTPEVVDAFDVGCKILITTQNKDVVTNETDTHFFEISGTFKKEESLALFANCLKKPVDFVKNIPQAGQIHDLCKGHPMSIALFGSQMVTYKQELLNGKRWSYFVQILQKKEYLNKQISAITSCLESLDKNLRDKYEDFAVFPEDVNITSKVLETMWNLGEIEVGEVMTQLENKSLIVSYYSNYHNAYIYGIHVVLLDYLKHSSSVNKIDKHRKLIAAYERVCNSNYARLPNDNYIFQYVGYHLQQAGLSEKFKIYFDLNFLGAKIKAIGIGDLLKDFKIYEKEIIGDYRVQNNKDVLSELNNFVKNFCQDLYKYRQTNIVQCGLKQPKDGFIYGVALEVAREDSNSLYFKVQPSEQSHCGSFSLPNDSTVACFAKSENELLIGTEDGDVQLWEQTYRRTLAKFTGHTERVIYLEVVTGRNKFLSVSEDGEVRVWSLDDVALRHNLENGHQRIPSPYLKQSGYKDLFGGEIIIEQSSVLTAQNDDKLTCAAFANDYEDTKLMATGSQNGFVTLWKDETEKMTYSMSFPIDCIKFSFDDLLLIGCSGKDLFLLDTKMKQELRKSCVSSVCDILTVDEDHFVTLHDNTLLLWRHETRKMPGESIPYIKEQILCKESDLRFITGAVSNNEYLYVSSEDHCIRLFGLKSGSLLETISEKNGCITTIDILPTSDTESVFLYRFENRVATVWGNRPHAQQKLKNKYLPVFACFWPPNVQNSTKPRIAVVSTEKRIQIMNSLNLLNETDELDSPVKAVCFSHCGNKVSYGLENGLVREYEIKTRLYQTVMHLHSSVTYLKYFDEPYSSTEYVNFQGECKGLLVAAGQNGALMISCCGKTLCLISPSSVSKLIIKPIIQCFYLSDIHVLLTVSDNRAVKVWYLRDGNNEVLKPEKNVRDYFTVTMAAMTNDKTLLAITMSTIFDVYTAVTEDGKVKLLNFGGNILNSPIFSCAFSWDNRYLALGCSDGCIVIYDLCVNRSYTTLQLHKSAVRYLLFSPSPELILVSIGEQIAWWNLNKLPDDLINRSRRSFRKTITKPNDTSVSNLPSQFSTLSLQEWGKKTGSANKPHLLRTIKLQGSHADRIFASPNYGSFVTIDDIGKLYILEMLE